VVAGENRSGAMTEQTADTFEVSPQQEELWRFEPDGPSGRIQATIALAGSLDHAALRAALARLVARHEILRTTFAQQPGIRIPLQAVSDEIAPAFSTLDLSAAEPGDQTGQLAECAAGELSAPLDYLNGPLVRAALVKLGDSRHELLVTLSALCADASSVAILARDLLSPDADGGELVEDPLQYADFSAWQRELREGDDDEASAARDFWTAAESATAPSIPFSGSPLAGTNGQPPAGTSPVGEHLPIRLDDQLTARLLTEAGRYGATATTVAQAAWSVMLGASCGEDEVTVDLLAAQRRHLDLEGAVGAFSRPVPIGASVGADVTFVELLAQVQRAADQALTWQDYVPVGRPGLAIGFVAADSYRGTAADLQVTLERVTLTGSNLRLWLTCMAGEQDFRLSLGYNPEAHSHAVAQRLAARLERLLASVAKQIDAPIGELDLLGEAERRRLLIEFNDSGRPAGGTSVHGLFATRAAAHPAREAVIDEHGAVTYGELEQRANQLANRLRRAGVGPDVAVGLCTDRSVDMVVGLLGILKAGGAYVPLHYEHPPARLEHQLQTAGAAAIVTQEPLLHHLPEFQGGEVICLDRDRRALEAEDRICPEDECGDEHLAYIIYTSGSTGTPKGVGVTHGNVVNYAAAIAAQLGATAEPLAFGVVTSISTDLGNTSVFGALCTGGTLVLVSPAVAAEASALSRQLQRTPIDVLKITPSHLGALIAGGDGGVLPRRWLVLGGERAPWDLITRVRAIADCAILNHYGPTEATIGCCTFAVSDGPGVYQPATVPIGRPIAGASCYVLDARLEPVPLGAPGVLHIGGAGVARGYVGMPDLTAERFRLDPFSPMPTARMYDTGDVARWLGDGALEFLGRADEQVKIRGYRVEPAEVEGALRAHDLVREAVVVTRPGNADQIRLIAYCTLDREVGQAELKAHLSQWLPEFMLPSAIVVLDTFPMTPSGKIDRLALPDPDQESAPDADFVAPRTPVEQAIADIWAHVLGVERVGIEDDFFALGGHSLLATQVVAQVRSDFAVDLPLHSLFTYPTVASLTADIVAMMGASEAGDTAALMAELEGLSDEEAERLLADEQTPPDPEQRA
jgi:amino acid adenylation domain-containing protein